MKKLWDAFLAIPQTVQLLLVAALVFGVTITVSGSHNKDEIATYIEKYNAFQNETKLTLRVLDSVKAVVAAKDIEVVGYMKDANDLRNKNDQLIHTLPSPVVLKGLKRQIDSLKAATTDSVELARTVIPKQDTVIKQQDSSIVVYKASLATKDAENGVLSKVVATQSSQIVNLKFANDSATKNLFNVPKAPSNPDKFLYFFPKPTRTQSAIVGFIAGVVTTVYLVKK